MENQISQLTTEQIMSNEILSDMNLLISDIETLAAVNPMSRSLTRVVGQMRSARKSLVDYLKGTEK